ncbi:MAG: glycoside hydrolase family 127 protein, partial [Thermoguttaceae bacterium]|nr:glycoside hydrolase family 127 protein [Thermoguttaceae bacterium]
ARAMRRTIPIAFLVTVLSLQAGAADQRVTAVDRPDTSPPWTWHIANRPPLEPSPRQAAESCSMAEYMLSHELMLKITGNLLWADRCEEVAFNSFPSCMTADLKSLRYLTAPNHAISDRHNKSPGIQNRGAMFLFDPRSHRCCQHNIAHAWPYFAEHLWMATPGGGLAAVLYAPCRVTAKVAGGQEVAIEETTRYPFEETIELKISLAGPVRFPLHLRVPGWCKAPKVTIDGDEVPVEARPEGRESRATPGCCRLANWTSIWG